MVTKKKKEPQNVFGSELLARLMAGNSYTADADDHTDTTKADVEQVEPQQTNNSELVEQSIETIVAMHVRAEQNVDSHQRAIETITSAVGRPQFFYGIILVVLGWVSLNFLLPLLGQRSLDPPPFSSLQGVIGLCALLMTTVVLITQRRQSVKNERRMQLNLQVNLIAERKVTKLIELVEELRGDLPQVKDRHDPQAEAMKEYIDPHEVLRTMSQMLKEPVDEAKDE